MNKSKQDIQKNGVGALCDSGKKIIFYYTEENNKISLKMISSNNGYIFSKKSEKVLIFESGILKRKINLHDCSDFNFSRLDSETYFLSYIEKTSKGNILHGAVSNDLKKWRTISTYKNISEQSVVVPDFMYNDKYVMYFGNKNIKIAFSNDLKKWDIVKDIIVKPRKNYFDNNEIIPAGIFLRREGIVLFYYAKSKTGLYSIGVLLFDKNNLGNVIYRSNKAIWKQSDELQKEKIKPIGITSLFGKIFSYIQTSDGEFVSTILPQMWYREEGEKQIEENPPIVTKSEQNPIFGPGKNSWEIDSAFNPTALVAKDNKVHILYRAIGDQPLSVLGCAISSNGIHVDKKLDEPIYIPRVEFEGAKIKINPKKSVKFMSGGRCWNSNGYSGGSGGVEDARIVEIEDRYYLTYVAYNGATNPRIAISSISVDDYNNQRWDKWKEPVLMSRPEVIDKSACILPEKYNDKYVIYHRIYPNILIDLVDSLDFDGKTFLKDEFCIKPRPMMWDSKKVAMGAAPIKTKYGWLAIYLAVGRQDPGRYKVGAMLLDLNDPRKVICRSNEPIIEPTEWYENGGHKAGVVYPCGAVIHNNRLFIYYGGSDKYTCVAHASADNFLEQLINSDIPKVKKVKFI